MQQSANSATKNKGPLQPNCRIMREETALPICQTCLGLPEKRLILHCCYKSEAESPISARYGATDFEAT